ncbi:TPA: hypothetical protein ACH3X3_009554 [Trebouxia sp. C0006]
MSHSVAFQSGTLQHLQKRTARCCPGAQPRKVSSLRAPFRKVSGRSSTLIKAEDAQEKGDKIDDRKKSEQTSKLVEGMKKGGIDQSTAQRILETWEQTGATTTDALRKMLLGRSLKTVGIVLFQLLLDGGAAYGSYNSARYVGQEQFLGKVVIEYGAYFLASYFAIGVIFDTFTLGVLAASAVQYSTNTEAFMAAVKEVAGASKRGPSINVVEKAQTAVNAVKVASALNQISSLLKKEKAEASTLRNLSALLTLSKAKETYGFKPEKYGLSDKDAAEIAAIFSKYDLNDDMRLEELELRRLASQQDIKLDDNELTAAMKLLDKRGSGYVEFDEFVDWWVNKIEPQSKELKV